MISPSATVTIKATENNVNDGGKTITVNHPDGSQIHIVGDCGGSACDLQFAQGQNGIVVDDGHTLGSITNLGLIGGAQAQTGVLAHGRSNINNVDNITIQGFFYGMSADFDSHILANHVAISNSVRDELTAGYSSSLMAENASLSGSKETECNALTSGSSTVYLVNANIKGGEHSLCALNTSTIFSYSTNITGDLPTECMGNGVIVSDTKSLSCPKNS